ncbi:MAG: ABC transporter permease [Deltaproteobacteria bacterium]|nr:ABC transporter permease [Deltaproteobacteria bacterium]
MTLLRIAFRNVLKNRRRSLIAALAIAFGYMAVCTFKGYTHDSYEQISTGAIYVESPGHLVIFKQGFLEEGRLDPEKYLFSGAELQRVTRTVRADPDVVWVAPKLSLSGLVTNGAASAVFLADAMDPADERSLWSFYRGPADFKRQILPETPAYAAFIAPKLARVLRLTVGSDAVVMATTQSGQMNAVDIQMVGEVSTLSDALDDKYLKLPLALARNLYDFDGADRLCVLLSGNDVVPAARARLARTLAADGSRTEIKSWDELSVYYQKVKGYLDVVFLFLFTIVLVIVVMGTFNTMSMAVYERTREVGTLRALGLKRRRVVALFAWEGALLGVLGSAVGSVLTVAGHLLLRWAHVTYNPPGIAKDVAIAVDLVPRVFALGFVFFVALSIGSAALPALRAARHTIVDALGHV